MKLLILTSCTGEKHVEDSAQLTLEDFQSGPAHVKKREKEISSKLTSAEALYSGQQHVRLMRGIDLIRGKKRTFDLDFEILSAGYGLIPSDRKIAPYEATFTGMKKGELREWAAWLDVGKDFAALMSGKRDLNLILLGDLYLDACGITEKTEFASPTLLFCGGSTAKKLPKHPNLKVVVLSNPEAKRFSCGLVALKGEMVHRICTELVSGNLTPAKMTEESADVLALLDDGKTAAPPKKKPVAKKNSATKTPAMRPNPKVDKVIQIPKSWWDKPHRKKLRYFIPEWDDLVDPDYGFLDDVHSGGRGNWSNEVYAHQMYPEPNYDGILISRAVAEKSKSKTERINEMGVHRMLRVPRKFPIMGDCGAFDYIMEDVPPYSTEDVIDYYTRLDFDVGVSVDHLIVKATDHQRMDRYNLTIENAAEFLKQHRKEKLPWTPVGAVQGWEPAAYAEAAAQYSKMGYDYIGLGGLVRSTTKNILAIVEAVRAKVPSNMRIHLFGIARPAAVPQMIKAGVTSIDSASHLRRAWLGAGQNYFALNGNKYTAIRIPQAGKSFRAKRMVSEGRISAKKIEKLERDCLRVVRDFDRGESTRTAALDTLCEYDNLIDQGRQDIRPLLEEVLTDTPWKSCPCDICQKDKIEVIIFRGNNRNRRRGFHNTFVFYQQLMEAANTGKVPGSQNVKVDPYQPELFDTNSL